MTCTASGTNGNGYVLTCTANSTLPGNVTWSYTFPATGTTPGDKNVTAALTKPDFNPANDRDSAVVTVLLTCRVAANGGLRCSPGQAYTGPDDRPLANSSQALFDGQCCVSAAASVLAGCSSTCGMRAVQC